MDAMDNNSTSWTKAHSDFISACMDAGFAPRRAALTDLLNTPSPEGVRPSPPMLPPAMPDAFCRQLAHTTTMSYDWWRAEWGLSLPPPESGDFLGDCHHGHDPAPEAGSLYELPFGTYLLKTVLRHDASPGEARLWGTFMFCFHPKKLKKLKLSTHSLIRVCHLTGLRVKARNCPNGCHDLITGKHDPLDGSPPNAVCPWDGPLPLKLCIYCGQPGAESEARDPAGNINRFHAACEPTQGKDHE